MAGLVSGKDARVPACIIRVMHVSTCVAAVSARQLVRPAEKDLFRYSYLRVCRVRGPYHNARLELVQDRHCDAQMDLRAMFNGSVSPPIRFALDKCWITATAISL